VERPAAAPAQPAAPHAEGSKTPHSGFPRLTYDEAHAMLLDAHARGLLPTAHIYGDDFGSPDETYISSQFSKPVMVHRYPASVKAFYMQPDPLDPTKALCVDVLAPEGYGEIIGGSQRVDDYDLLKSRIEQHNLPMEAFQWLPGPPQIRQRPPQRFRHGHRALRSLDLRPRTRPRNHPLPKDPQSYLPVISMKEASDKRSTAQTYMTHHDGV